MFSLAGKSVLANYCIINVTLDFIICYSFLFLISNFSLKIYAYIKFNSEYDKTHTAVF